MARWSLKDVVGRKQSSLEMLIAFSVCMSNAQEVVCPGSSWSQEIGDAVRADLAKWICSGKLDRKLALQCTWYMNLREQSTMKLEAEKESGDSSQGCSIK